MASIPRRSQRATRGGHHHPRPHPRPLRVRSRPRAAPRATRGRRSAAIRARTGHLLVVRRFSALPLAKTRASVACTKSSSQRSLKKKRFVSPVPFSLFFFSPKSESGRSNLILLFLCRVRVNAYPPHFLPRLVRVPGVPGVPVPVPRVVRAQKKRDAEQIRHQKKRQVSRLTASAARRHAPRRSPPRTARPPGAETTAPRCPRRRRRSASSSRRARRGAACTAATRKTR